MKPKSILIVEDEAIVAMDLQARLEALGYSIAGTAASGEQALALASVARPDLVMMDIRLQGTMDGITAAQEIRARTGTPIVFLTAHAEEPTLQRAKLVEPFGYILKPFQDRELRVTLEMALFKHHAETEIRRLSRLYSVLSQINQMIVRTTNISTLAAETCSLAVKHGAFPLVWLGEYDLRNPDLLLRAAASQPPAFAQQVRALAGPSLTASVPPATVWEKRPILLRSGGELTTLPAAWSELVQSHQIRAFAVVPIRRTGSVWGILCFAAREADFFGEQEQNLVQEIGLDIGYAIENLSRETERRRIHELLEQREAMFRSITDTMRDMVCLTDRDGRYQYVTPSCQTMLGYFPEQLLGQTVFDLIHPDDRQRAMEAFQSTIARCEPTRLELRLLHLDGRYRWIESVGNVLARAGGTIEGLVIASRDVTDQKKAQETVQISEARYRGLVETAYDWIWEVDAESRYVYASPKVRDLLGFAPEEILGRTPFELMPPEEAARVGAVFSEIVANRKAFASLENTNRHRDGRLVVLETSGVPVMGPKGEFRGYRGVDRDITERKRLEAQLQHAQKMEAIGQLAGGVAHDFNNILAAMLMQLGLLQVDPGISPEIRAALGELEACANRAANLTRQLLLFSRRQVVNRQLLDLDSLVGNLLKMLRRLIGENITLECAGSSQALWVNADPGMLEQVVLNLLVNARDAMPNGGRVTLQMQRVIVDPDSPNRPAEARAGEFACLTVTDTGCGMSPETLEHIFEPFFTTKESGKGTGLGLATVYGIVKRHEGWLEVESQVGRGTTLRVYLPEAKDQPQPTTAEPVPEPVPGGQETILLVEDDLGVREIASSVLQRAGYQVIQAANGQLALETWLARRGQVDLLLTDMMMPEGVTGVELAQRLRGEKPSLKVIIMSGYSLELALQGLPTKDHMVYLPKPFTNAQLAETVRRCLDEKQERGTVAGSASRKN